MKATNPGYGYTRVNPHWHIVRIAGACFFGFTKQDAFAKAEAWLEKAA